MADNRREQIRQMREEANAARREQEEKARRRRFVTQISIVVGSVVLIAAIVIGAIFLTNINREQALANMQTPEVPVSATTAVQVGQLDNTVADVEVPLAFNSENSLGIQLGNADAPIKYEMWIDYSCPHCQQYELGAPGAEGSGVLNFLEGLISSGDVSLAYIPVTIVQFNWGAPAANAMAAVATYAPEMFAEAHRALTAVNIQEVTSMNEQGVRDLIKSEFSAIGIENNDINTAIDEETYFPWLASNTSQMAENGVTGTPTLMRDGEIVAGAAGGPIGPLEIVTHASEQGAAMPEAIAAQLENTLGGSGGISEQGGDGSTSQVGESPEAPTPTESTGTE